MINEIKKSKRKLVIILSILLFIIIGLSITHCTQVNNNVKITKNTNHKLKKKENLKNQIQKKDNQNQTNKIQEDNVIENPPENDNKDKNVNNSIPITNNQTPKSNENKQTQIHNSSPGTSNQNTNINQSNNVEQKVPVENSVNKNYYNSIDECNTAGNQKYNEYFEQYYAGVQNLRPIKNYMCSEINGKWELVIFYE